MSLPVISRFFRGLATRWRHSDRRDVRDPWNTSPEHDRTGGCRMGSGSEARRGSANGISR